MKKIKDLLKHYLKRRSKVTEALIIIFLITGSIGYSQIIEKKNSQVIISNDGTVLTITKSGLIDGSESLDTGLIMDGEYIGIKYISGNGVIVNSDGSNINITNGGAIRGNIAGTNSEGKIISQYEGNGIYDVDRRSEITNTGVISGNGELYGGSTISSSVNANASASAQVSANGVHGEMTANGGMILGNVVLFGKTATYDISTDVIKTVFAASDARATGSANGVYGDVTTNIGMISGSGELNGGIATCIANSERLNIQIIANATANATGSANGVRGNVIANTGTISGNAELSGGTAASKSGSRISHADAEALESANGVYGEMTMNTGMISGNIKLFGGTGSVINKRGRVYTNAEAEESANGILGNITENRGKISGSGKLKGGTIDSPSERNNANASATSSANGVYGSKVENNSGLIRGHIFLTPGTENHVDEDKIISFSGNGIGYNGTISSLSNSGLIMGSESAVAAVSVSGTVNNYGILAGRKIFSDGSETIKNESAQMGKILGSIELESENENNQGIYINLNNDENRSIASVENGKGGTTIIGEVKKTILNANRIGSPKNYIDGDTGEYKDSYNEITSNTDYSNYIINGAGIEKGTLNINEGITLSIIDSIVNGYEKAITLEGDNSELVATNTIFNGGRVGVWEAIEAPDGSIKDIISYKPIIIGGEKANFVSLKGNSIVNGDIDLGKGNDNLIISNTTQLNGDLYGGGGIDNLQLGDGTINNESGLSIFGKIENFENIYIKGEVTLYETAKIMKTDTNIKLNKIMRTNTNMEPDNIYIGSNNILNLRINPEEINSSKEIIGHALYGSNLKISTKEDKMMRASSSTTNGTFNIITNGLGLEGTIAMSDDKGNKVTFDENISIETDSIIYNTSIDSGGDIVVKVKQGLNDDISYPKLDLVYKSITSSGDFNIDALYPTVGGIGGDKTSEDAKKELLFLLNDIFAENPYGYALYSSKESMDIFGDLVLNHQFKANAGAWMVYGGAAYGDTDSKVGYSKNNFDNDIDVDENIYGGYALAEYGISKDASVGLIVGGTNSKIDISNGSKLEGNSFYIGTYGVNEINNFRLKAGIGYQYTDSDTTRIAANTYQYEKYENSIITNGFSAYTGVIYSYELGKKYFLEPKLNLTYTRISQNSVDEGKEALAIEADAKTINYLDTEMGLDLVKEFRLNKSTIKIKGGVSYLYALDGGNEDYITGRMDEGSDFDILVPERDKGRGKIGSSLEVEQYNGFIYNIGGGYITGSNVNEYYVGTGIGFKF